MDLARDLAPDLARDLAPDSAIDLAPDLATDLAPDLAPDSAPDSTDLLHSFFCVSSPPGRFYCHLKISKQD